MENPTCRQYNLYMHEEDTFPCRRYIVKYDDKGIAEEAFSIKRNNTEDFPEFFDDRIFKRKKAVKTRALERAFSQKIEPEVFDRLAAQVEHSKTEPQNSAEEKREAVPDSPNSSANNKEG